MKNLLMGVLLSGLMLMPLCEAKTPRQPAQPVCAAGKLITTFDKDGMATRNYRYYRCLLKQDQNGYQVQDFYWPSNKPQTDPFVLVNKKELKAWSVEDTTLNGGMTWWYESGQKSEFQEYVQGRENGLSISWYENGQKESEGQRVNGQMAGAWQTWYATGQKKMEVNYNADGQKSGPWREWHENGQKEVEGNFNATGQEDGSWVQWYENGQKELEGRYVNGQQIGTYQEWYENGRKQRESQYDANGQQTGRLIQWYENGQKRLEGRYVGGQQNGTWTEWRESGRKLGQVEYKNGELIDEKYWDKDGKEIAQNETDTDSSSTVAVAPAASAEELPAECEAYLTRVRACYKKIGGNDEQLLAAFDQSLETAKASWASIPDRAMLANACNQANQLFEDSVKQSGC